ncbi:MAG: hypothetical protein A2X64_10775 [Ignavibacteria bacterium GWF2_33_9]|nr:MAG: hypothetical protein A2X64_10775 [Ignavibacteria bacterium GWF2_33_9]
MKFEDLINEQLKNAMKAQDKVRIDTIRSIRTAIIEFNKSGIGREMTEEEGLKMLNTLAKKRKEAIEMFEKGNRPELAEKEKQELVIIQEFLPKQITEEEVRQIIQQILSENYATQQDFGRMMGLAMKQLTGKFDGSKVQAIIKELLS